MNIIEQKLVGKAGNLDVCEDAIVAGPNYIAVIDGATAKGSRTLGGQSPGRLIAQAMADYLSNETDSYSGEELIARLTHHVNVDIIRKYNLRKSDEHAPSAAIAVYTASHRRLTRVGDVQWLVNGEGDTKRMKLDVTLANVRSLYNRLLLADGLTEDALENHDRGRELIMPVLLKQYLLRNSPRFGEWAYGAIDGFPIDPVFVETRRLVEGDEVVLCSDGYPIPLSTLGRSEDTLERLLARDPLRIYEPETKGLYAGAVSFDDRAYVRFKVAK